MFSLKNEENSSPFMVKQKDPKKKGLFSYGVTDMRFFGSFEYSYGELRKNQFIYSCYYSRPLLKNYRYSVVECEAYTIYPVNLTAYPSLAFKGSKIIDGRLDYFIQDGKGHGWLCDTEPKLIYRSNDRNFWIGFHHYCDDKGRTLVIAKTKEGCIFGGITSQSWKRTPRPGILFLYS